MVARDWEGGPVPEQELEHTGQPREAVVQGEDEASVPVLGGRQQHLHPRPLIGQRVWGAQC